MPAVVQVNLKMGRLRRWAARRPDAKHYLRRIELAPCASPSPANCLLRGTRELPWGQNPQAAIRTLIQGEAQTDWPEKATVRLFDFVGPIAQIDDWEAEADLLSPKVVSPIWEELRELASGRRLGVIELSQSQRLMVPVMAMRESGARVEWATAPESTFPTSLAFGSSEGTEDW